MASESIKYDGIRNDGIDYQDALSKAHALSWDQRWPEAIREFNRAITLGGDEPIAYAGLGMAHLELGRLEEALENYKLAARYSHGDMLYLKHVADVQERLGQLNEAGQTYMAIGEILLRRKKLDEAVGNWLRAVRLEPDLVGGHQRLATVYRRQGLIRGAIREYLAMARIYYSRGEEDQALKICQEALELDPRNADVLTAIELIRRGETFFPDDDEPSADKIRGAPKAHDEAVERMTSVFEAEAEDWDLVTAEKKYTLLESAQRLAQQQLAKEIFAEEDEDDYGRRSENSLSKLERDSLISQALDFQTREMVDEAIDCYNRAIEGGVSSAAAHFCLGILYQQKGRHRQAMNHIDAALKDEELQLGSHYALGDSSRQQGNMTMAVGHYINVLEILDLEHIEQSQAGLVHDQYVHLANGLATASDIAGEEAFIEVATGFLNQPDWDEKIKETRRQLDRLAAGHQILILGDMLAAGSPQVLESMFLSQEYAEAQKYESAVEEAYRAIQLSPYYLPAHTQLAELMARQERSEVATAKFLAIGDTYRVRGDINGAIRNYERVVQLSPMDLPNRAHLIAVLVEHGLTDQALGHYLVMGESYYNLAAFDQARKTYIEALRLAPEGSPDRNWRSRFLRAIADIDLQRLDWKRALLAYNELRTSHPDDESITLTLVDLSFKVGQPKNALRFLDHFFVQLVRSGKSNRIVSLLEEMVADRPTEPGLTDRLARLYARQGRNQEAIKLLDRLGEAQLSAGETQNAIGTIKRILQFNPPNAASYQQLLRQLQ